MRLLDREKFDALWVPRLGQKGADEKWRRVQAGIRAPALIFIPACAASFLWGSALGDVAGRLLILVALALIWDFRVRRPLRIKAIASDRFGVPVKGIPGLSPRQFDEWCARNGYTQPADQVGPRESSPGARS